MGVEAPEEQAMVKERQNDHTNDFNVISPSSSKR